MYDKIWNPNTNRYVALHGKLGKIVLKHYVDQLQGGSGWTTYDKGVRKPGINRIRKAMKNLGLTTSTGGAELEQLKKYIGGVNPYGSLKPGFNKKWSDYLKSKSGVEELADILESKISGSNEDEDEVVVTKSYTLDERLAEDLRQAELRGEVLDLSSEDDEDSSSSILAIEDGSASEKNVYYCMNPYKKNDTDTKTRALSCKSKTKVGNQLGKKKIQQ